MGCYVSAAFNLSTYVVAALVLWPSVWMRPSCDNGSSATLKKTGWYILIMSVGLFANSYCKTLAAVYLDSAQLYPVNQGCALILSTLMSAMLFGERITRRCVVGLLIAFIGLLCIHVG